MAAESQVSSPAEAEEKARLLALRKSQAEEKRRLFALKKVDQAVLCFSDGDWSAGLPKARAALELLEGAKGLGPDDTSVLCGGVCLALAACNRIGEALEFFCAHALEIADEQIKDQLLQFWLAEANAFVPGDLVQLGARLVGVILGPTPTLGRWQVRVTGTTSDASATAGPGEAVVSVPEAAEAAGEELDVAESDMTLLSIRLSDEQRASWRELRNERPELLGQRMKSDNEARWQRLFGAAARRDNAGGVGGVGASANAAAQDLGLPLEQSFAATLYGLISDCLEVNGSKSELTVDVLGCRPALELDDPSTALASLLEALPSTLQRLTVRMCGPEVGCDDSTITQELQDGRCLHMEIRCGLYHDAYPAADADLVVAMNAGVGVPQYTSMWGPTLDLLANRPRRALFAITSYTAGELLREERMLRSRWGDKVQLSDAPELSEMLREQKVGSCTLASTIKARSALRDADITLHRGDVIRPECGRGENQQKGLVPTSAQVSRCADLVYVGPNKTPGRNRNYGKLVLWIGGNSQAAA